MDDAAVTPNEKLERLLAWLVPAWTPEQRRQTVESVLGNEDE